MTKKKTPTKASAAPKTAPSKTPQAPKTAKPGLLQTLRQERGLSRGDLSAKAGISDSFIKNIETRGAKPSVEVCQKLAVGLGVPVELLIREYRPGFLPALPGGADAAATVVLADNGTPAYKVRPTREKAPLRESTSFDDLQTQLFSACQDAQRVPEVALAAYHELATKDRRAALGAVLEYQLRLSEQSAMVARLALDIRRLS
jgi:transcriptional regulator with XRE-family HTH domain